MSKASHHPPGERHLHPRRLLAIRFFIACAFLVGAYLLFVSWRGMSVIGCGPESGCGKVLNSRWAYWFGIPVSLFALIAYATVFVTSYKLGGKVAAATQRQAWNILVPAAVLVIGAAVWFCIIQLFIIHAICPFCMAAHGSGFLASLILLWSAPFGPGPEKPWQREKAVFITSNLKWKLSAGALVGVALLVSGQVLHQKKTFRVTSLGVAQPMPALSSNLNAGTPIPATNRLTRASIPASNLPAASSLIAAPGPKPNDTPETIRLSPNKYPGQFFVVYNTNVLDLQKVPIIGSAKAPWIIVSLYDYTCHHCQLMHAPLMEAYRMFSNQVAIISLPMPLDPACNAMVRRAHGPATNACHYARLGLAVWLTDRAKLQPFDDWMFASANPPTLEIARQFASQLVGPEPLARALSNPWIEQQLQQDLSLYEIACKLGQGSMPQIIIGRKIGVGTMGLKDLLLLLEEQYGLKAPPSPL